MRKAIAILPVVSAIYPMITGATALPTIVMISNEENTPSPIALYPQNKAREVPA